MLDFFRAGGWSMFVVLILSIVALGAAVLLAIKPEARKLGFVRAISTALVFAAVSGLATNLAAVGYHVPKLAEKEPNWGLIVLIGMAESLSPVILGFTVLTIVWILAAVGVRKLAGDLE